MCLHTCNKLKKKRKNGSRRCSCRVVYPRFTSSWSRPSFHSSCSSSLTRASRHRHLLLSPAPPRFAFLLVVLPPLLLIHPFLFILPLLLLLTSLPPPLCSSSSSRAPPPCLAHFLRLRLDTSPASIPAGKLEGVPALCPAWLEFPGSSILCPCRGRVVPGRPTQTTRRRRLCYASGSSLGPDRPLIWFRASTSFSLHLRCAGRVSFPTNDGWGYLFVYFQALRSAGIIFVGICGVLVLIMAFPHSGVGGGGCLSWCRSRGGVGIPVSSLPTLAWGIVHHRAVSLATSLAWLGVGGIDENELRLLS